MEGWTDFYVAEVGGAAALAGLLVVAISINVAKIMSFPHLPGRAAQTLVVVGGSLVLSSLALFPGQPLFVFGGEALIVGALVGVSGLFQYYSARRVRKLGDPLVWIVAPLVTTAIFAIPEIIGGALLVAGEASGLYWIATGIILSFLASLQNGWVLLIEILR
ncbi:MAG TPA: hypothetical protein VL418_14350 [Devosiaceae bacterium]|nr:hypothetical protein [Devosiaceae bacterium]